MNSAPLYKRLHAKLKKTPDRVFNNFKNLLSIVKHPEITRLADKNMFVQYIKIWHSTPTG